jgi:hypothetical protein
MGTADVSRSVQLDSIEEVALRRAKVGVPPPFAALAALSCSFPV